MMVHNLRNGDIHLMVVVIVFLENSKISESCTSQPFLHPTISRALFPGAGWNAFKTSAPVCYSSSLGCLKATKTCPQGSPWNGEQMWELCRRGMWDRQCIVETFEIQNNDMTGKHILIITALRGVWTWKKMVLVSSYPKKIFISGIEKRSDLETTLILYEICEYFVLYNRAEVKISDCVKSFKSLFNFSQTQGFSIILIMFNFKAFFFFLRVQHSQISKHLHACSWNAITDPNRFFFCTVQPNKILNKTWRKWRDSYF